MNINIEDVLSQRLNMSQIKSMATIASGNSENLSRLWTCVCSGDRRTSINALWIISHLPQSDAQWVTSLRDDMTDMLLVETDTAKKRMLLRILRDLEYGPADIRTDLMDFCLSRINSECEPYAVRCFSIYTAFRMCRHYPELLAELDIHLEMMKQQALSPGLISALRQTKSKIRKIMSTIIR